MSDPATPDIGPSRRGLRPAHLLLALAVALLALVAWGRGRPSLVAWELAWDHDRDFARRQLPARVWSTDPVDVGAWLESRGTVAPPLPAGTDDLELIGARYCALFDRIAAHAFYSDGRHNASVFVFSGPARFHDDWAGRARGRYVRLVRSAGRVVAVVGDRASDVEALAARFGTSVALARLTRAGGSC